MPKRTPIDLSKLRQPEKAQVDEILTSAPAADETQRAARVVSIPLRQILPDRFQARVILPPEIKYAFFAGEVDCYAAAQSLMVAADGDSALRRQVNELLRLGESILTDKQIEPATGVWAQTQAGPRFLLEAGERRFWSLCLMTVQLGLQEEPRLQVLELKESNRLRQVAENLQREDLSAVDLAKAVAALILILLDQHPDPAAENDLDYYRKALQIKRLPSGTWPTIERIVGFSHPYLFRHLQILNLDDELLYLASLHRLEERRLREIIAAPKGKQRAFVMAAIEERLSSDDLERAVEQARTGESNPQKRTAPGVHRQLASRIRSLMKAVKDPEFDRSYDHVARELAAMLGKRKELELTAKSLESLASSLRKIGAQLK